MPTTSIWIDKMYAIDILTVFNSLFFKIQDKMFSQIQITKLKREIVFFEITVSGVDLFQFCCPNVGKIYIVRLYFQKEIAKLSNCVCSLMTFSELINNEYLVFMLWILATLFYWTITADTQFENPHPMRMIPSVQI